MKWGLDAAYAPLLTEAHVQFNLGYEWFAGYIGGKAQHVWTPNEWDVVLEVGFAVLPIWVAPLVDDAGRQAGIDDGNASIDALQRLGMGDVVVLDVENGLSAIQYITGFVDASHAGLVDVVLYGLASTLLHGPEVDAWWLAEYPSTPRQLRSAPPDWTYWQFAAGDRVDFSVAADEARFAAVRRG